MFVLLPAVFALSVVLSTLFLGFSLPNPTPFALVQHYWRTRLPLLPILHPTPIVRRKPLYPLAQRLHLLRQHVLRFWSCLPGWDLCAGVPWWPDALSGHPMLRQWPELRAMPQWLVEMLKRRVRDLGEVRRDGGR